LPAALDQDHAAQAKLEAIRRKVGELMGIVVSQSIPKISFVAPARDYKTMTGKVVAKGEVSLLARVMAMGKMHKVFAITAAIPAAIGAILPDSVVNRVAGGGLRISAGRFDKGEPRILSCTIGRTARKILDGRVYVSGKIYDSKS
jgi:2-methylaconitate cis-trans-isomerase PrpF